MKKELLKLIEAADGMVAASTQLMFDLQRRKAVDPSALRIRMYRYETARRIFGDDLPPLIRTSPAIPPGVMERASTIRLDRLLSKISGNLDYFYSDFETLGDFIWNIADTGLDCYDENSATNPGIHVRYCSPASNYISSQIIPRRAFALLSAEIDKLRFNWRTCLHGPAKEYVANDFYK